MAISHNVVLLLAVDLGVQRRVVVHLKLEVEPEAAFACDRLLPEAVETAGEIVALIYENLVAFAVAFGVASGCVGPRDFFGSMENLQRQDRKAVDDEAGALGIQLGFGVGQLESAQMIEQDDVAVFGKIIAALIDAVDGAFHLRKIVIGGLRCAGFIFCVPQFEISQVLGDDGIEKCTLARSR